MSEKDPYRYYVYALIDPRDGKTFYIGKGCGNRVTHHVKEARRGDGKVNHGKIAMILSILAAGLKVTETVLASELTEDEAFRLETAYIAEGREHLTNVSSGGRKRTKKDELDAAAARARWLVTRFRPYEHWFNRRKPPGANGMGYFDSLEFMLNWATPGYLERKCPSACAA